MPYFCAVKGCGNKVCRTKDNPDIVYHRFPSNLKRLAKWIRFCGWREDWQPQKNQGICSIHFDDSCYDERFKIRSEVIGAKMRRQLKTDAVPGVVSNLRTFNTTTGGRVTKRIGSRGSAVEYEKDSSTEKGIVTMVEDTCDEDEESECDQFQDENMHIVEGKLCKICQSVMLPEAKYLLQHAVMGKSYKDIIQETLNVPVFYDDDESMRVCGKCSNFIEELFSFVKLCRENLARIVDKPRPPKQIEFQLSDEEECYDNDTVSVQEETPDSNHLGTESMIQEISIIHEPGIDITVKSEILDPLALDAGPSESQDGSANRDSKLARKSSSDAPVKCNVCGKIYTNERQLQVHMNLHTKKIEYPCQYCERVFYVWRSQKDHEQTHLDAVNNIEYRCNECTSVYSNKKHLDVHFKLNHLGIRKYACVHCDFCTNQKYRLLRHVRSTHTDKRPYGCTVCESTSSNAANYYIHFQRHIRKEEVKAYNIKCAYCALIFTKDAVFERHLTDTHLSEAVIV